MSFNSQDTSGETDFIHRLGNSGSECLSKLTSHTADKQQGLDSNPSLPTWSGGQRQHLENILAVGAKPGKRPSFPEAWATWCPLLALDPPCISSVVVTFPTPPRDYSCTSHIPSPTHSVAQDSHTLRRRFSGLSHNLFLAFAVSLPSVRYVCACVCKGYGRKRGFLGVRCSDSPAFQGSWLLTKAGGLVQVSMAPSQTQPPSSLSPLFPQSLAGGIFRTWLQGSRLSFRLDHRNEATTY